jgi:hypothetical protein
MFDVWLVFVSHIPRFIFLHRCAAVVEKFLKRARRDPRYLGGWVIVNVAYGGCGEVLDEKMALVLGRESPTRFRVAQRKLKPIWRKSRGIKKRSSSGMEEDYQTAHKQIVLRVNTVVTGCVYWKILGHMPHIYVTEIEKTIIHIYTIISDASYI